MAEESGFDFVSISDHFHPWLDDQGHSPFVWTMLGALAERTTSLDVVVGVTCPIMRIHPAILAQATATTSHLLGERFTWGVGTGEALNEHILGDKWPPAPDRLDMLEEAIEVIRQLWTGDEISFHGEYFTVENARVYDAPPVDDPGGRVGVRSDKAAELAAADRRRAVDHRRRVRHDRHLEGCRRVRAGLLADRRLLGPTTRAPRSTPSKRCGGRPACPGQLMQDLPTPGAFRHGRLDRATRRPGRARCSSERTRTQLDQAGRTAAIDAGVDHLYFHQIGDDQEGSATRGAEDWRSVSPKPANR